MKFELTFKLVALSSLIMFSSCETEIVENKDQPVNDVFALSNETIRNILTSGSWKMKQFKINNEIVELQECSKDDEITFNVGGSFDYDYKKKCEADEDSFIGYWGLAKKNNKVMLSLTGTLSDSNERTEYQLKAINQNEAVMIESVTQRGQTFLFETTYMK